MKKMIVLALLVVFVMPLAVSSRVLAAGEAVQAEITDAGNQLCPVMGGPVSGKDFVVFEGKRYGLCCPGCEKTFRNDPVKYVAKVNAAGSLAAPAVSASEEMERDMEQGSL
jgi:YHS domain-containing protein